MLLDIRHGGIYNARAMQQETSASLQNLTNEQALSIVRAFMNRVYAWMAGSLFISAGAAAWAVSDLQLLSWVAQNMMLCAIIAIGILLVMSFMSTRLSASAMGAMLLVFAAIEGLTLGPVVAVTASGTLATALACTAGTFGVMSIIGATTRVNLQGFGRFFMMMLIGLLIAMIVNIFMQSSTADLVISCIGVLLFSAMTAYDTQRLNMLALCLDGEDRAKGAIHGATQLYLDFLNLFLFLLSLLRER